MSKTSYQAPLKPHLIAVTIAGIFISSQSFAAGFQVNETSATGLGRAFAGDAVIADNASVIARNPAAMTRFQSLSVSGSLSFIEPSIDIEVKDGPFAGETAKDVAPTAYVPAAYMVSPINNQLAWGLGLFSNYGFSTDYPNDFSFGLDSGKTELLTININPSIAYQINQQLSIGAGISLVYADAELTRNVGFNTSGLPASTRAIKLAGDTWEWGWNIGLMYEIDNNNRLGLSYRSQVDLDFEGDFDDDLGASTGVPGNQVPGDLTVVTPAIFEFGGFHQLNSLWAFHYGIQWIGWSEFKELTATSSDCVVNSGVCFNKEEDYDNNFRYSIGTTYTLNPMWTLRAGFALDEQAGAATLSIPDTDRYWYSAGFTYSHTPRLTFDFGFTYLYGDSGDFTEATANTGGTETTFNAENYALLFAGQVNYTF